MGTCNRTREPSPNMGLHFHPGKHGVHGHPRRPLLPQGSTRVLQPTSISHPLDTQEQTSPVQRSTHRGQLHCADRTLRHRLRGPRLRRQPSPTGFQGLQVCRPSPQAV